MLTNQQRERMGWKSNSRYTPLARRYIKIWVTLSGQ